MTKSVLYVEDNFNNTLLVKRIVQAEGHHFMEAIDGEMGWQVALTQLPDLIFVDLRLPGEVDGLSLIRRLKAEPKLKDIPAIVLTAYGGGSVEKQAREAGCDGFLHKPADIRQIRAVIREHVGSPAIPTRVAPAKTYRSPKIPTNP